MSGLIQVRDVAQTLGVHENTLRRWEQRGFVQGVRPQSGVRRLRPPDIEALGAQMFNGSAPLSADEDVVNVRATSVA